MRRSGFFNCITIMNKSAGFSARHICHSLGTSVLLVLSLLFVHGTTAQSEVSLPGIFNDGMVLQRGIKAPVWGKADPGEKVTVIIDGRSKSTKTAHDGSWSLKLGKLKAGGPFEMTVSGTNTITYSDVMIGDVWLCSGQSNMQFSVEQMGARASDAGSADFPAIRMIKIPRDRNESPQEDFLKGKAEWIQSSSESVGKFSAVAYFFGRELHTELDVPIGLINASWGGTQAEDWTPYGEIESNPQLSPIIGRWEEMIADYPRAKADFDKKNAEWKKAQSEGRTDVPRPWAPKGASRNELPGGIYNAKLHPVIPYGIKGAVWYQGESNTQRGYQYRTLLKTLMTSWRDKWGQGDFPFIVVQLANWETDTNPYSPKDGGFWPELREAQLMALDLKNTALVVTIDLGEETDIHPKNKRDVGKRVAIAARNIAYGHKIVYSGPIYKSLRVKKGDAIVRFSHIGDGLVAKSGPLMGFEIAGADRKFHKAEAIIEGDTIIVNSGKVANPKAVRYAWDDYPECNLYNSAGLPASPFRSDDWPRVTQDNLRPYSW